MVVVVTPPLWLKVWCAFSTFTRRAESIAVVPSLPAYLVLSQTLSSDELGDRRATCAANRIVRMLSEHTWPSVLTVLLEDEDLSVSQADWAMGEIMAGRATGAQAGAFLVALQRKGVTVDEIVGFRDAILAEAREVPLPAMSLDIVGTGGD